MGTRSLTKFFEENEKRPFAVMYRQFDGHPESHGQELADFIASRIPVNGIPVGEGRPVANGIGCLAAQVVEKFKAEHGVGGIYLMSDGDHWQEYEYEVRGGPPTNPANENSAPGSWHLKVFEVRGAKVLTRKLLWEGDPAKFNGEKL